MDKETNPPLEKRDFFSGSGIDFISDETHLMTQSVILYRDIFSCRVLYLDQGAN